jgi:hypothetical protein
MISDATLNGRQRGRQRCAENKYLWHRIPAAICSHETDKMKYSEINPDDSPTNRYGDTHPVLTTIQVRDSRWQAFRQMIEDIEVAKLVAAKPHDGHMLAHVACLDDEVAERLDDGWGA